MSSPSNYDPDEATLALIRDLVHESRQLGLDDDKIRRRVLDEMYESLPRETALGRALEPTVAMWQRAIEQVMEEGP